MSDVMSSRAETRSRIVDAALRLLREHGPAAVTTRGVAEHAGVQAPAIYRLFGDKDQLLEAVAEQALATYVSTKAAIAKEAAAGEVDPIDDLRDGWQMQIDFGVASPTLFGLLSDPERAQRSPAARSGRYVLESRVHRIAMTGRLRVSEQRAVDLIHAAGTGTVVTILSTPVEQRRTGLADDMYEAVLRQILSDGPARIEDGSLSTTIAFRALAPKIDILTDAERLLLAEWLDRAIGTSQV